MDKLRGILEELLSKLKEKEYYGKHYIGVSDKAINTALSAIKKELEACVPNHKTRLNKYSQIGFNQCRTETLNRIKGL